MSAPIVQMVYTRDSGSTYGITLKNSQIARPFFVNNAWSRLRVGLWFVMTTGSIVTPAGTPKFTIGFCSGSYLYGDVNCGHFAGCQRYGPLTYVSNSTYFYQGYYDQVCRVLKKVDGIETILNADMDTATLYYATENWRNSTPKHSAIFVDLQRPTGSGGSGSLASGSYTVYMTRESTYTSTGQMQWGESTFLANLVATSGYTFPGNDYGIFSSTALIDEINDGYFDRVYVGWDREAPDPEIKIIAVAVVILA